MATIKFDSVHCIPDNAKDPRPMAARVKDTVDQFMAAVPPPPGGEARGPGGQHP